MDVKAIILIGGRTERAAELEAERIAEVPIALIDVLGEPVLQRVLWHLERVGITGASVVTEVPHSAAPLARGALRPDLKFVHAVGPQFWRAAENAFAEAAQAGAETVVVVRIGPYAEIDYEELIQVHVDSGCRVSSACDMEGEPLDCFVISALRRNDAAFLFRHELRQFRVPGDEYRVQGYVNRLRTAADLRRLALDAFAGTASIRPQGTEIKPGVWAGEGARVHRRARVLAPAFIGARSRVGAMSVITRGSVLEHHAEVDCGTVIENATVLPFTSVGAALDVSHSVVGFRQIANLRRKVDVQIGDPKLVGVTSGSAPLRTVTSAVRLAFYLPITFIAGLFKTPARTIPENLPEAVSTPSTALRTASLPEAEASDSNGFSPNFAAVRRYGNE
ncbi:MAG TPA: hypothetical protein VN622_11410 [Clostridia bacterium]|nr:hypothetical protein [Clostridia bacterium]